MEESIDMLDFKKEPEGKTMQQRRFGKGCLCNITGIKCN